MDEFQRQVFLLAEDSENDVILMKEAFATAGIPNPIFVVSGGEEAITYLKGEPPYDNPGVHRVPFVLLLDLNMPGKNGFEVLQWVRAQPTLKRLVVIVLTSSNRAADADRAYDLGANFYVTKPGSFKELVEMIKCLHSWLQLNHFPNI
ncbi:MAG: response regulator [Verrucomicrobiota bacterium]